MRFLPLAAILLVASLVTSCTKWPPPKQATWKNTTSLEEMEKLYWQAIKQKDWNNVEAHTASTYTHLSGNGALNKQQALEVLKSADLVDFSLGEFRIVDNGGTSVVTYSATFIVDYQGRRIGPTTIRRMAVWQQHKNGWAKIADSDVAAARNTPKM
jgi:hypothetical protein